MSGGAPGGYVDFMRNKDEVTRAAAQTAVIEATPAPEREPTWDERLNSSVMRLLTDKDDKATKFSDDLGASDADKLRLQNALDVALMDLPPKPENLATVNKVMTDMVGKSTPDKLINALESQNPDAKPVLEQIKADPNFKQALFDAVSKDPTVLAGLDQLVGSGSSIKPADLAKALEDPETRRIITDVLEKTAQDPNLKFADISDFIDSAYDAGADDGKDPEATKKKRDRYRQALAKFGETDSRLEMADAFGDPGKLFSEFMNNPREFFEHIRSMLHLDGGTNGAFSALFNTVESVVLGYTEDPSFKDLKRDVKPFWADTLTEGNTLVNGLTGTVGDQGNVKVASVDVKKDFGTAASGEPKPDDKLHLAPVLQPTATPQPGMMG